MTPRAIAIVVLCATSVLSAQSSTAIDKAFDAYWKADDPGDAARAADRLIKAGVDFDTAWAKLETGRSYKKERTGEFSWRYQGPQRTMFDNLSKGAPPSAPVAESFEAAWERLKKGRTYHRQKTGRFSLKYPGPYGDAFDNVVEVPAEYDPARKWPLRVQLHGGVGRPRPQAAPPGRPAAQHAPNRIPGDPQIYVYPSAWGDAQWWTRVQLENILRVVADVKKAYNVDESRIYLTGISDGGTGAYYIAMKAPTIWSAVLPLNGSMAVIRSERNGADGAMFGNNLVNKPLYIVNGEEDPLYPVFQVEPHIEWLRMLGVDLVFRPQAGAGHNTAWWPNERASFERFVHDHPRQPHPAKLSWETERTDVWSRVHWLVIDRIGRGASDADLKDTGFFRHEEPSGRVDIERTGNTFTAQARGVRAFTLLLSPDVVDFARPVRVTVNGKELFHGPVEKDVAVLTRWAARDDDRTLLYGAELAVGVP